MSGKLTDHKGWRIFFGTPCGAMGFSGSFHRPQSCWWVALNRFWPLHQTLFFTFYSDLPQGMDNENSTAYKLGEETCRIAIWSLCDTPGGHNPALIKTAWPGVLESSYFNIIFNKCWELNAISCRPGNQGHSVENDGDGRRPRNQQTHCTWSKEHETGWWAGGRVGGGF